MTETITASEYMKLNERKRNKFGAKIAYRCEDCGGWANKIACLACQSQKVIKFASKAEAKHYDKLRVMQDRDQISCLELQPAYPIYIKGKLVCKVVLDFQYWSYDPKQHHVVDVKGHDNALSRLKRKLFEASYHLEVEVIK